MKEISLVAFICAVIPLCWLLANYFFDFLSSRFPQKKWIRKGELFFACTWLPLWVIAGFWSTAFPELFIGVWSRSGGRTILLSPESAKFQTLFITSFFNIFLWERVIDYLLVSSQDKGGLEDEKKYLHYFFCFLFFVLNIYLGFVFVGFKLVLQVILHSLFYIHAVTDLKEKIVFTIISFLMGSLGILAALLGSPHVSLFQSILGAGAGYVGVLAFGWLWRFVTGRVALGEGDPEVLAGLGAWVGAWRLWCIVSTGCMIGSLYALMLFIFCRKRVLKLEVPLIPFLYLAYIVCLYIGHKYLPFCLIAPF